MAAEETEPTDDQWNEYSFVVSSQYRIATISRLAKGPATPSQISDHVDVRITHISRALQELREQSLVDLLVSDDRKKGRVYGLTEDGREIDEMVDEHYGGA